MIIYSLNSLFGIIIQEEKSTLLLKYQNQIDDLQNEHKILIKTLKSQLSVEKEAEIEELKRNFSIEKGYCYYMLEIIT